MKKNLTVVLAAACSLTLPATLQAGDSSKGVIIAPPVAPCSDHVIQPLFSRYAQTATQWTLRAGYRSFKDMELQEQDGVDGSTYDLELIMPITDRLQARLYLPFSTNADGKDVVSGDKVDIDGDGGLLDFPSLILDYQFKKSTGPGDYNLAAYAGIGYVFNHLEAKNKRTGEIDRLNHRGSAILFGLKADKQLNNCWIFIGNVGGRYYWESDDIHPNGGSDKFFLLDASAAWIYAPSQAWIYPGVELVYQGDLSDYNSLQVVPQVTVPIGSNFDINAGVSIGVLDDGPSTEARLQMNLRF